MTLGSTFQIGGSPIDFLAKLAFRFANTLGALDGDAMNLAAQE